MPLSEHEQRLLDQMEQALYAEDPKFVSRLAEDPGHTYRRKQLAVGALGVLLGLGVVVLGVMGQQIWLGGLGFALMVAGAAYALNPARSRPTLGGVQEDGTVRPHRPRSGRRAGGRPSSTSSSSFMGRLEQRWERRQRDDGR